MTVTMCAFQTHIAAQRIRHTCRVIKHGSNLAGLVEKHTLSPPRPSLFPRPTALPRCIFKLLVATAIRKSFLNHLPPLHSIHLPVPLLLPH